MSKSLYDAVLEKATTSGSASAMKLAEQNIASQEKAKELFNINYNPTEVDHYGAAVAPHVGMDSASQLEKDSMTMYPSELYGEYGEDIASDLTTGALVGKNEHTAGRLASPDLETRLADGVVNVGGAFIQDFADTAHLGGLALTALTGNTVPFDKATGWVADSLEEGLDSLQSPYAKAREKEYQANQARRDRDNANKIYDSPLDRLIDETKSGLGALADNPEQIVKSVESAVGSLLSGYTSGNVIASQIAKQSGKQARKKAEKSIMQDLKHNGLEPKDIPDFEDKVLKLTNELAKAKTPLEEATLLNKIKEVAPYVLMNAASEGGNNARATYNEVNQMTEQQLLKGSQEYRDRRAAGETHEEARRNVALIASQVSVSKAMPFLIAANFAVGKIEAAPFKAVKSVPATMAIQAGEEAFEEGMGTFSSNHAIRQYADKDKDVLEGVGSDIASGLVAGAGMAGTVKAPSLAAKGVSKTLNVAGKGLKSIANKAEDKTNARLVEKDSTQFQKHIEPEVEKVKSEISEILDNANKPKDPPEGDAPDSPAGNDVYSKEDLEIQSANKEAVISGVDSIINPKLEKDNLVSKGMSEELATKLSTTEEGGKNIIEQAGDLLKELGDPNNSEEDKLAIAGLIADMSYNLDEAFNLSDFGSEDIRKEVSEKLDPLIENIQETSTIMRAMENVREYYSTLKVDENITKEAPDDVMLHHYVNKMEFAPETLSAKESEAILKHAENSDNINEYRKARLASTHAIIKSAEDAITKDKGRSDLTKEVLVSLNLVTNDDTETGKLSAKTHIDNIYKSMGKGDTESAKDSLNQLRNITAHMLFKLNALSESIKKKKDQPHWSVSTNGEWFKGKKTYGVSNSPKSIAFAKGVETEANFLVDVYNQTAKAFPELGMKPLHNLRLGQSLPTQYIRDIVQGGRQNQPKAQKKDLISEVLEENKEIIDNNPLPKEQFTETNPVNNKPVKPKPEEVKVTETKPVEENPVKEEVKTEEMSKEENTISKEALEAQRMEMEDKLARKKEKEPTQEFEQLPLDLEVLVDDTLDNTESTKEDISNKKVSDKVQEAYDHIINKTITSKILKNLNDKELRELDGMLSNTNAIQKIHNDLVAADTNVAAKGGNGLFRAFNTSVRTNSSFAFIKAPLKTLTKVLGSAHDKYAEKFKNSRKYAPVASAYKEFINTLVPELKAKLNERLNSEKDFAERIKEGKNPHRYQNGQMLNIAKLNEEGKLEYDDHFIELAIFASLQTMLNSQSDFNSTNYWDVLRNMGADMSSLYGDKEALKSLTDSFGGSTTEGIKRELTRKISEYWGLKSDEDSPEGLRLGIPESVAAELITVMKDVEYLGKPLVTQHTFQIPVEGTEVTKKFNIFTYMELPEKSPLSIHDNVIDTNILKKPESVFYIGNEVPSTAKTVVRSSVTLSKETQKAVEASNKVEYKPDEAFYDFTKNIGEDALNDFIYPETAGDISKFNVISAQSARSKRDILRKAFKDFEKIKSKATDMGQDLLVRFNHFIASEGRIHQSHPGVQTNKALRELLSPTNDTLDLTDPRIIKVYTTALAQGFGVNVSYQSYEKTLQQFNDIIDYLSPQIEAISDWMNGDSSVDLKEVLASIAETGKIDNTMVALHNLFDYVRMTNSPDISKFNTNVYIELDGITSGSTLATLLFGTDLNNPDFINILERGGLLLTNTDKSYNSRREAGEFSDNYMELSKEITESEVITLNMKNGLTGYSLITNAFLKVFPNMVKFDENSLEVSSTRNFVKNLLTVIIYGSGAKGIASKYVENLTEKAYILINKLAVNGRDGLSKIERDNMISVFTAINNAMRLSPKLDDTGTVVIGEKIDNKVWNPLPETEGALLLFDAKNFEFSKADLRRLTNSVRYFFAEEAMEATHKVMTPSLIGNMHLVGELTNDISKISSALYRSLYNKFIQDKKKDPNWNVSDGLTKREIDSIENKVKSILKVPAIGGMPQMTLNKYSRDSTKKSSRGMGQNGELGTNDDTFLLDPLGVAGIATTTIKHGDARVTHSLAQLKGDNYEATGVHDGTNLKLARAEEYGRDLNRITIEDVTATNVFAEIGLFYKNVRDNLPEIGKLLSPEEFKALSIIFFGRKLPGDNSKKTPLERMKNHMDISIYFAKDSAIRIEAVQQTLRKTKMNVAHYNGLDGANYVQEGIEYGTPEWTELYAGELFKAEEKMNKMFGKVKKSKNINADFKRDNSKYETIRTDKDINKQLERYGIKEDDSTNSKILNKLTKHPLMENVRIRIGNMYDMMLDIGRPPTKESGNILGAMTKHNGKTLILIDRTASKETVTHEVIHAVTYEAVTAYIRNGTKGLVGLSKERAKAVGKAIEDTKEIMNEFMSDVGRRLNNNEYVSEGEFNLYSQIMSSVKEGNSSNAILEFMAWLTNEDVKANLKSKEFKGKENFWANAQRSIKTLIKNILSALGIPNMVIENQYDRLVFNTMFVAEASNGLFNNQSENAVTLHHAEVKTKHPLTRELEQALVTTINSLNDQENKIVRESLKKAETKELVSKSSTLIAEVASKGFPMDSEDAYLFSMLSTIMSETKAVKPEVMRQMQNLYRQAVKEAKVEDFMTGTIDRNKAEKLHSLLSLGSKTKTTNGSSYLVPSFVALATVNKDFANGLSNITKKSKEVGKGGFDSWIRALGDNILNSYIDYSSNNLKAANISEGIENAIGAFIAYNNREASILDKVSMVSARSKDWANDKIVQAMDAVGDTFQKAGGKIGDNKLGNVTKAVGIIINDKDGKVTKRGMEKIANASWTPHFLRELLTDLTGLTDTNAPIYKMIKKIKSSIQRVRQLAREQIPSELAKRFKKMPTKEQWETMYRSIGKIDLSSLLNSYSMQDITNKLLNDRYLNKEIKDIEKDLSKIYGRNAHIVIKKAKELANYLNTGEISSNQLMNASQISKLQGEGRIVPKVDSDIVTTIDSLVSLYAFEQLDKFDKAEIKGLLENENEAISELMEYHKVLNNAELSKEKEGTAGKTNRRKGWLPFQSEGRSSLIVMEDHLAGELLSRGYTRVGDYKGSRLDTSRKSRGYYFIDTYAKAPYHQGVIQNVKTTINGVDDITGFGNNPNAGVITDPKQVKAIYVQQRSGKSNPTTEGLIPIYLNEESQRPYAYERALDPEKVEMLSPNYNFAELIGIQRGRQLEEQASKATNIVAVDHLINMYEKAKENKEDGEFINILDKNIKDPVILDAVKLLPKHVIEYVNDVNEGILMVPRSMINDTIGYRMAVVGDAWTGNTRFNKEAMTVFREVAHAFLGDDAYRKLMKTQFQIQDLVQDARTIIVIKSVVVPVINLVANYAQLVGRGVPLRLMQKETPRIVEEINYYNDMIKEIEGLKIDRDIAKEGSAERRKAENQIQSIEDSIKKLSIAPLIEAGEFASVSTSIIDSTSDGLKLGSVDGALEKAVDRLPEGVKTLGKYAVVSSDTALFQLMQKMTDYGDFVTKAILYKDLTTRKKMSKEEALGIIIDEFIHYDKLQGRTRHTLENLGMFWFYNWKIRATKIGVSMLRNNPFHTLIAASIPIPEILGNVGLPFEDSILGRALGFGSFSRSIGPSMGIESPLLNPWINLFN